MLDLLQAPNICLTTECGEGWGWGSRRAELGWRGQWSIWATPAIAGEGNDVGPESLLSAN